MTVGFAFAILGTSKQSCFDSLEPAAATAPGTQRRRFTNGYRNPPVLFQLSRAAAQLREFAGFTVEPSHQARPGQDPATVTMYTVVAQRSGIGQREVIAEFPLELHAEIFRDMAEATARAL